MPELLKINHSNHFKGKNSSLQELAIDLAKECKIDESRALQILNRTAVDHSGNSISIVENRILQNGEVGFRPCPYCVFELMPLDRALSFLETEDLNQYRKYSPAFNYIVKHFNQFLTLQEWENMLSDFIAYLEKNREHIIETGFPKTKFLRSYLLEYYFSNIYCIKQPIKINKEKNKFGEVEYQFIWPKPPAYFVEWDDYKLWILYDKNNKDMPEETECRNYKDASILGGIDLDSAQRVENNRATLFNLEIKIL